MQNLVLEKHTTTVQLVESLNSISKISQIHYTHNSLKRKMGATMYKNTKFHFLMLSNRCIFKAARQHTDILTHLLDLYKDESIHGYALT